MKVLNLRCANGHGFEGWFGSEEDFMGQNGRALIECPLCADTVISRLPAAPRLHLSGSRASPPEPPLKPQPQPADLQAQWLSAVRHVLAHTEDVGPRFAEEVRRIHYGEAPHRGIRGRSSQQEREALLEEGIETLAIPLPVALDGPVQ
jgi:hypothetical protein